MQEDAIAQRLKYNVKHKKTHLNRWAIRCGLIIKALFALIKIRKGKSDIKIYVLLIHCDVKLQRLSII